MPTTCAATAVLICFGTMGLYAQGVRVAIPDPDEHVGVPVQAAENRRHLTIEPSRLLDLLLSSDSANRASALRTLGMDPDWMSTVIDARLIATNMDTDRDFEFVLVHTIEGPPATFASVFDKAEDGWWQVGHFGCCFPWSEKSAETFISLKATVHYGRNDLLVRGHSGGGGGLSETELTVYRLYKARLYRVFRTVEESWSLARVERSAVIFPEEYTGDEKYVVVGRSRWMCSDPDKAATCRTRALSCTVNRWDPKQFTFVVDAKAQDRFCNARTRMPHAAVQ